MNRHSGSHLLVELDLLEPEQKQSVQPVQQQRVEEPLERQRQAEELLEQQANLLERRRQAEELLEREQKQQAPEQLMEFQ